MFGWHGRACFDVHAKTRVVQICQVRRQVHPADVFDGGLFVIKLGRAKMLQTWKSSCDSPGVRKMTNRAWFRKSTSFWRRLLRRQKKGISFLLGRRWVYQILVLSGDDVAVVEKMGSTWFNLVVPFEPEEAGFTGWSSNGRNWQRFAVDELATSYSCVYQVRSKDFDRGILHCWQHFKWKCGRSFGNYAPPKSVHIPLNFRRGRCFVPLPFPPKLLPHQANHRQLNDTILPCSILLNWRSFCPRPVWQDIVELLLRTVLGQVHSLSFIVTCTIPILRECSSYLEVDSARVYWTVYVCRQFLEDWGLFNEVLLNSQMSFACVPDCVFCYFASTPRFSSDSSDLARDADSRGVWIGDNQTLLDSHRAKIKHVEKSEVCVCFFFSLMSYLWGNWGTVSENGDSRVISRHGSCIGTGCRFPWQAAARAQLAPFFGLPKRVGS